MSDVTDILCAVRSGDLDGGASPLVVSGGSVASGVPYGLSSCEPSCLGISGTGELVRFSCAVEDDESRLLSRDRDRERSACEVGRGVMSGASSKVSYPEQLCQ